MDWALQVLEEKRGDVNGDTRQKYIGKIEKILSLYKR